MFRLFNLPYFKIIIIIIIIIILNILHANDVHFYW